MGITQVDMLTGLNKVETAVALIQAFTPPNKPYQVADSGGKDSDVIVRLAEMANVPAEYVYCVSPIDPPEIYYHLRQNRPNTRWEYHARGFWKTVVQRGLPRRQGRWCCEVIKEAGGDGRTIIVGNRRSEGRKRSNQNCYMKRKKGKLLIAPIVTWTKGEVWEFHRLYDLPYCSLYDEGYERLGCIMCPQASHINRMIEMEHFPKIARLWRKACDGIVEKHIRTGSVWEVERTPQELWDWWINLK